MTSYSTDAWLPPRTENSHLRGPDGEPAIKMDSLDVADGSTLSIAFESVGPRWRQGVLVVTNGVLEIDGTADRIVTIWADEQPLGGDIFVRESVGRVLVYNIWDSDRGKGRESLSYTSGMLIEELPDGSRRYRCNDIGRDSDFTSVVFRVSVQRP